MKDSNSSPQPTSTPSAPTIRRDGWTIARQEAFLTALAAFGCVRQACKAVGMSHVSAYRLRARPAAISFRLAWDAALDCAMNVLEEAALSRAINGVPRPIFYQGEQIGEWRHHDERLAMFLLRYRRPLRFGSPLDRLPPPPPPRLPPGCDRPDPDEAMTEFEILLGQLTDEDEPPVLEFPRALDGGNFGNFADDCDALEGTLERGE